MGPLVVVVLTMAVCIFLLFLFLFFLMWSSCRFEKWFSKFEEEVKEPNTLWQKFCAWIGNITMSTLTIFMCEKCKQACEEKKEMLMRALLFSFWTGLVGVIGYYLGVYGMSPKFLYALAVGGFSVLVFVAIRYRAHKTLKSENSDVEKQN